MSEWKEIGGVNMRCAVGADNDGLAASFTALQSKMPVRMFIDLLGSYNRSLSKCAKCDSAFLADNVQHVASIPHWFRGKFHYGKSERGRPAKPVLDEVWPDGKWRGSSGDSMCLPCVLDFVPKIVETFSTLTNAMQVQALAALSQTAKVWEENRWSEHNPVVHRFFTKLTQELIPHIRKRGKRQVQHLTALMVSCNLLPKEEEK